MGFFSKLFSPKMHCQPPYDFFISYKGQHADTVRPIAEQLMAHGFSVWFAEYGNGILQQDLAHYRVNERKIGELFSYWRKSYESCCFI